MRKSLNGNPIVAIAVIAVLGIGVAFLLLSSLSHSSSSTETATTSSGPVVAPAVPSATPTAPATTDPAAAASATAPATTGAVDPVTGLPAAPTTAPAAPANVGSFVAGPGLPDAVVTAFKRGDAVALLIVKRDGIDDRAVHKGFRLVASTPRVTAFETLAEGVARYARITEGVDLDRVPALVVLRPKSVTGAGPPKATVTYGFNSPQQLVQAVHDALYKGPENLPYHPR